MRWGFAAFAACLALHALAVRALAPLSLENLGPLALAWHDGRGPALLVGLAALGLAAARWGGTAIWVALGAASANAAALLVWGAVPDYIAVDLVVNASDVVLLGALSAVVWGFRRA